ncbi:hypothetical protein [Salinibacter ruber]|uniref:hypothetical protein n=1 Tax=Salinibacter ruber TaxID=146919 RepID=UPI002167781E|nr:hypothetical protein [Salinibacter ruber]MCS4097471.1 hypothetical protein [Salinibacter ruber]MCS4154139.1 hypothetical protein [Salinibacter ruber]
MSRSRLLLPLLAVLFILGACQSEGKLTGEVFIVTEGGSNVELGDTEVRAVSSEEWKPYLREKRRRAKKVTAKKVSRMTPLLDSLEDMESTLERREDELRQVRNRYQPLSDMRATYADEMPTPEEIKGLYTVETAKAKMKPYGDDLYDIRKEKKLNPIDKTKTYFEVKDGRTSYWIHGSDVITEKRYKSHKRSQRGIDKEMEVKEMNYEKIQRKCESVKREVENISEILLDYGVMEYYFKGMPDPEKSDRTNSEGKFELTLTQNKSYYLVAKGRRSVGEETERYHWMVETSLESESSQVMLSNSNMSSTLPDSLDVLTDAQISTDRLAEALKSCN